MNTEANNPITTEAEYDAAIERIHKLMQLELPDDSPEMVELEMLARLVEEYENIHYPICKP